MVNYKYCPSCNGANFVACKRCRQCDHVFIPMRGMKRRSRPPDGVRAPAASGGGGGGGGGDGSLPTARRRAQQSSSSSFFASYASSVPSHASFPSAPPPSSSAAAGWWAAADENQDTCAICSDTGRLLCCDVCPLAYHLDCVALEVIPKGHWACPRCVVDKAVTAEKGGEAAARDRAEAGKGEQAEARQGGGAAGAEGGKASKAAGAVPHGLDSEQQSLWSRLLHDQAEETEVDGLLFVCFPQPAADEAKDDTDKEEEDREERKQQPLLSEHNSAPAAALAETTTAAAVNGEQEAAGTAEAVSGSADPPLQASLHVAVSVL